MNNKPVIAIVGGTGQEGSGLAKCWNRAGYPVIIGSRDADRAKTIAAQLPGNVEGASNAEAIQKASIVVMTVPYAVQLQNLRNIAELLKGKILVDVTVPLVPPKVSRVQLPEGGSAIVKAQEMLGAEVRVVSAFQNISSHMLADLEKQAHCDVLICGDDPEAREAMVQITEAAGMRAWHAGPLANSAASEALTSVLIFINRKYKSMEAGIKITGVNRD